MIIGLIILGIFILYFRCLNFNFIIDDIVRRYGYLYDVPETSPPPSFYSTKPHWWRHFFPILTHAINAWLVFVLFGWVPALLFAFSPVAVPGVAWITGGYYSVTALLTLTTYFFVTVYPNIIGAAIATVFFTAALGSTITCLGLPFLFLFFHPIGLVTFLPTIMYLRGRRFLKGYQIRNMGKQDILKIGKIPVMSKVIAYYIKMVVFPYRLAFFRNFGEEYVKDDMVKGEMEAFNKDFWVSLGIIALFTLVGWHFSPIGTMWFLVLIAPFSQFKVLGQFVAERYVYLPLIGYCVLLGSIISAYPIVIAAIAIAYIIRSHFYIPAYATIESLYEDGIRNEPDCLANYANLGERYIHTGRLLEGAAVLQQGIDKDPDNFLCYTNTAAFWVQVKDIAKALYYTQKSVEYGTTKSSWNIVNAMRNQMRELILFEQRLNAEIYGTNKDVKKTNVLFDDTTGKKVEIVEHVLPIVKDKEASFALELG